MFFKRRQPHSTYDPAAQRPALRCSICTGEQVAGFRRRYGIPSDYVLENIY